MDYLTQREIVLVMQKMEAITFSRFRRASKRLYRIADEAKNLSVMVDRRLVLFIGPSILREWTLRGTIRNLRCNFEQEWRIENLIACDLSIPLKDSSPFIGFTFRQLEMSLSYVNMRRSFSILKGCKWRNTTLITNKISDPLLEMIQPKELFLAFLSSYYIYKPLPISIKKMFNYQNSRLNIELLKNVEHVIYYRPICWERQEIIENFFEYDYNWKEWKLKTLEIRLDRFYKLPIVLTIEGAVNYTERRALEEIHPHFENLCWKLMDSSVKYFTKSVRSDSESGEKFNITLTKRAEYKSKWIQIVLTLESFSIWAFNANFQIQCL